MTDPNLMPLADPTPLLAVAVFGQTITFEFLIHLALGILAILIGGVVHEYGHAWAALKRGDDTAKQMGRLNFAPERHLDPVMTFLLPAVLFISSGGAFMFGGMKPVPVQPAGLRHPDRDMVFTAAMGPVFELFVAAGALVAMVLLSPFLAPPMPGSAGSYGWWFLYYAVFFNVIIAFFNLIPIPPLDGSRILRYYLPSHLRVQYDSVGPMAGLVLIIVLAYLGVFRAIIGPIASVTNDVVMWTWNHAGLVNLTGPLLW